VKCRLVNGRDHDDLINLCALFKSPQAMNQERDARQSAKLLRLSATRPRAPPGGDNDGNIHNDERGMLNDELPAGAIFLLFIIPRSSFII